MDVTSAQLTQPGIRVGSSPLSTRTGASVLFNGEEAKEVSRHGPKESKGKRHSQGICRTPGISHEGHGLPFSCCVAPAAPAAAGTVLCRDPQLQGKLPPHPICTGLTSPISHWQSLAHYGLLRVMGQIPAVPGSTRQSRQDPVQRTPMQGRWRSWPSRTQGSPTGPRVHTQGPTSPHLLWPCCLCTTPHLPSRVLGFWMLHLPWQRRRLLSMDPVPHPHHALPSSLTAEATRRGLPL